MNNPQIRTDKILVQELLDETLIYDSKIDKVYCLNHSLSAVWNACDGKRSFNDLRSEVSAKLRYDVTDEFILLSLKYLGEHNLLTEFDGNRPEYSAMSRRNLIKKAGLATMIALPVITMIIAPPPSGAASAPTCIPPSGICNIYGPPCCNNFYYYCNPVAGFDGYCTFQVTS